MPPHQQRVIEERDSLSEKVGKLSAFITGAFFKTLADGERCRLLLQYRLMVLYVEVLNERISEFPEAK